MPKKATELPMTQSQALRDAQRPAFRAIWDLVESHLEKSVRHNDFLAQYSTFTYGLGIKGMTDERIAQTFQSIRTMRDVWLGWPNGYSGSIPGHTLVIDESLEGIAFLPKSTELFMSPEAYFKPWAWASQEELARLHDDDSQDYATMFANQIFKAGYERVFFALTVCKWQAEVDGSKLFPGLRFAFTRAFLAIFLTPEQRAELNMTRADRDSIERAKRRAAKLAEKARKEQTKLDRINDTIANLKNISLVDIANANPATEATESIEVPTWRRQILLSDSEPFETESEMGPGHDDGIDGELDSESEMDEAATAAEDQPQNEAASADMTKVIRDAAIRAADEAEYEEFATNRLPFTGETPSDDALLPDRLIYLYNNEGIDLAQLIYRLEALNEMIQMLEAMSPNLDGEAPTSIEDVNFSLNQWIEVQEALTHFINTANVDGYAISSTRLEEANATLMRFRNRIIHHLAKFGAAARKLQESK